MTMRLSVFAITILLALLAIAAVNVAAKPEPDAYGAMWRGVGYLQNQYNPSLTLLPESSEVATRTYWLFTDNRLAAYALESVGVYTRAAAISSTIASYGYTAHGLIEGLRGQPLVAWPPYTPTQTLITQTAEYQIKVEQRITGTVMNDWQEYADLSLFGALDAFNQNDPVLAHQRYQTAMRLYDGMGFQDKADQEGRYATYKLALALHVGLVIGEPVTGTTHQLFSGLVPKQAPSGGFYTFCDTKTYEIDTNTETTAYAILALNTWIEKTWFRVFLPLIAK